MPYFFILPAFVLYVVCMVAALVVIWLYPPASAYRRYIASILLWSSLGLLLSTVIYVVVLVVIFQGMDQVPNAQPSAVVSIAMAGMLFIGPFVASAVGLAGGAAFGVWRSHSRTPVVRQLNRESR